MRDEIDYFDLDTSIVDLFKSLGIDPKARDLDPFDVLGTMPNEAQSNLHLGTVGLDYDTLAQMARTPAISAIIGTRVNQVAEFSVPQEHPADLGFVIRMKDREAKPSRADKKRINALTDWMLSCGDERIGFELNLEGFLRMVVRDSLIYDQGVFEPVKTRGGKIAGFVPIDAKTIRRAVPSREDMAEMMRDKRAKVAFVQLIRNKVVAEWGAADLAFCIRRPRTAIETRGYGYPELEDLIRTVTSLLSSETYNAANFTHGMHAAGILAVKSKMTPQLFRAFRREFYSMLAGAANAHKTPIIQLDPEAKEELQSVNLSMTNKEMEFKEWMAYLQKIACAIYQIDPAELGFIYGAENQSGALSQGGPEGRLLASRDKGLRPLLRAVRTWLNRWIVSKVAPDLEITFAGLDADRIEAERKADQEAIRTYMTPNEIRAKHDLPPIPKEVDGGAADLILDASYMGIALQMKQAAMQPQGADDGQGDPGADGQGDPEQDQGLSDDTDLDAVFGGDPDAAPPEDDGGGDAAPEPEDQGEPLARSLGAVAGLRRLTVEV